MANVWLGFATTFNPSRFDEGDAVINSWWHDEMAL